MVSSQKITVPMIRALCYADVFEYPLTLEEMVRFGIYSKNQIIKESNYQRIKRRKKQEKQRLRRKSDVYETDGEYYFLTGRRRLVEKRKKREKYSKKKMRIAEGVCRWLRYIPGVQLIGVTASVAMLNADKGDDIDILVIAKDGWLWTVRFFVVLLLELAGTRRRPSDGSTADAICANMFLDEAHSAVPENERDIFSAHEVVQVHVLFERKGAANLFYGKNAWVLDYLPGIEEIGKLRNEEIEGEKHREMHIHSSLFSHVKQSVEALFKRIQLIYMKSRRTNEIITDGYIRFHPHDARTWILREYHDRLRRVGLK